jgi:spore maturation protein CgeB
MRIALFCHSLLSDWNHGNAHFLRGIVSELVARGHEVRPFEPVDAWSIQNLVAEQGAWPLAAMRRAYPLISPERYDPARLDLARALDGADLVLVHEWNDPGLVARLGRMRLSGGRFRLLFHDTHHRAITSPESMAAYDLSGYDGVLAFGKALRDVYLDRGWIQRAWVWHEAADTRAFRPTVCLAGDDCHRDLVFIGNWGDDERTAELRDFVLEPSLELGLRATFHGVRYPEDAQAALAAAGVRYDGWLPNFRVPQVFAHHRVTVHVPRRPYATALPGIPTIRVFEALACAMPLVCAPWSDCEGLFHSGSDYLPATSGAEMKRLLALLVSDPRFARELATHGRRTVLSRHTCAHRVDELMAILAELGMVERSVLRAEPDGVRAR